MCLFDLCSIKHWSTIKSDLGVSFIYFKYTIIHKDCNFNDDCRAFIYSYFNKLCWLQQLPDCIDAWNIFSKRLQGSYKKWRTKHLQILLIWVVLCRRWRRILCGWPSGGGNVRLIRYRMYGNIWEIRCSYKSVGSICRVRLSFHIDVYNKLLNGGMHCSTVFVY